METAIESSGHTLSLKDLEALEIYDRQIRSDDFYHNAGWYTQWGEKIGWGDLSRADIKELIANLHEPMLLLYESDSFWNFVTEFGDTGDDAKVNRDQETLPTREYVLDRCAGIIIPDRPNKPGALYRLSNVGNPNKPLEEVKRDDFKYFIGHSSKSRELLGAWRDKLQQHAI